MTYHAIQEGRFLARPNRFIAEVEIKGVQHTVHVKNTGRCKELLTPHATVFLEESDNPNRKTRFDLVAVYKGDLLVNLDSQAPNQVFREWAEQGNFVPNLTHIKGEKTFGASRFDFYWETPTQTGFTEVKGVTLEDQAVARFPDAPTQRGVKHIQELVLAKEAGHHAALCFVVQMTGMQWMEPNWVTHPQFGQALQQAQAAGVEIFALECTVTPDSLVASHKIPVKLSN